MDNLRDVPQEAAGSPRASPPGSGVGAPLRPQASEVGPYAPFPEEQVSLLEYLNVLLRRWRIVAGVAAAFAAGLYSFTVPPTFRATAAFVREIRSGSPLPPGVAGVAAQFGVSGGSEASQSPRFYAEVVKSRDLMERVLLDHYADPRAKENSDDSATLLEILGIRGPDGAHRLYAGVSALTGLVSTRVDMQTGIVRLSLDGRYPELAAAVANRFLDHLNEFNAKTWQLQGRERRKSAEERVAEAERELRRAEEELKTFYERNRSWPGIR